MISSVVAIQTNKGKAKMINQYKINIFVTNRCNAKSLFPIPNGPGVCDFCFRPIENIETNYSIIDQITSKLREINVCNPITITGGEPLVSPYLPYLVESLANHSYKISLHTNGILLKQKAFILPKIQYVSLPYDGHVRQIADYYRGDGYFDIEKEAFSLVEEFDLNIGLHTLVTPYNVPYLREMADSLIEKTYCDNVWYWYLKRFKKINHARHIDTGIYDIDINIYRAAVAEIKSHYSQLNIISSGEIAKKINTLFIALDGMVYIYSSGQNSNALIGNLCRDNINDILSRANDVFEVNPMEKVSEHLNAMRDAEADRSQNTKAIIGPHKE